MFPISSVSAESVASMPTRRPSAQAGFADALKRKSQPREVAIQRTPMTGEQAADALRAGWTKIYGSPPNRDTLAVLLAQWSHETGSGQSMYNYNFGGIKGSSPEGLTMRCRTREGHGANERTIRDNFRAYRTAADGAEDYLRLLDRRYGSAMDSARAGAPVSFVKNLKRGGYFTGSEAAYIKSVSSMTESIRSKGYNAVGVANAAPQTLSDQPISRSLSGSALRPLDEGCDRFAVDTATAVSVLTLGMPDSVARSATRILGDNEMKENLLLDQRW